MRTSKELGEVKDICADLEPWMGLGLVAFCACTVRKADHTFMKVTVVAGAQKAAGAGVAVPPTHPMFKNRHKIHKQWKWHI